MGKDQGDLLMKVKIDFQLSRAFSVVDRIIFRFVLNGITDTAEIVKALPLFSDSVMANSIKHLTNEQLIRVEDGYLLLSEPIVALINACISRDYELPDSSIVAKEIIDNNIFEIEGRGMDSYKVKEGIIREMLPGIKPEFINALDFTIKGEKDGK